MYNYDYLSKEYRIGNFIKPNPFLVHFDLKDGPWIAGGYVRCQFEQSSIRDIDVYFKNKEQLETYQQILNNSSWKNYIKPPLMAAEQNIFNLVDFMFFDSAQDVIESIDFTCCAGVTDGKTFVIHDDMYQAIEERRLTFMENYKVRTRIQRFRKYLKYKYTPDIDVVSKIFCLDNWEDFIHNAEFKEPSGGFNS